MGWMLLNLESSFNKNPPIHFLLIFISCSYPWFLALNSVCNMTEKCAKWACSLWTCMMEMFLGFYWMVVNSWFINGFLTSLLGKCCHSTYIRQGFWLGWKYTRQKPHCLLCDFLCPRGTDFSLSAEHLCSISDTVRFLFNLNCGIRRIPVGWTSETFSSWRHTQQPSLWIIWRQSR